MADEETQRVPSIAAGQRTAQPNRDHGSHIGAAGVRSGGAAAVPADDHGLRVLCGSGLAKSDPVHFGDGRSWHDLRPEYEHSGLQPECGECVSGSPRAETI